MKSECINEIILFGEGSLRRALEHCVAHYHTERPQRGIGNKRIEPVVIRTTGRGEVIETERLGGLLRSYPRAA